MMAYLILANISLIVFYFIYHVFLRKLTFFQGNRIYLLSAVILSYTVPAVQFMDLSRLDYRTKLLPAISLEFADLRLPEIEIVGKHPLGYLDWNFEILYTISILGMIVFLLIRLFKLYRRFHEIDGNASFSFLNFIYLGEAAKSNAIIHRHEMVHVQQGHSYDILLLEFVRVFNWFNPVLFFYIKELKFQHECIADELCAAEDKTSYAELLIANALRVSTDMLSHQFASESILKKRIMMLFQNKSKKSSQWKYMLMVPFVGIIALVGLVLNNTVDAKTEIINTVNDVRLPVVSNVVSSLIELQSDHTQQENIVVNPEVKAEPAGGMNAFMKYVGQNFKYSEEMIKNGINGTIEVQFMIDKDGTVSRVKAKNDIGYGSAKAAEQVIKDGKKWRPAVHHGKAVRSSYLIPIKFEAGRYPEPTVTKIDQNKQESSKPAQGKADKKDNQNFKAKQDADFSDNEKEVKFPEPKNSQEDVTLFSAVEVKPSPPNGMNEFMKYVGENYEYPEEALKNGINGVIELSFIVEKDGSLSNLKIKKDLKYGAGQAAFNLLKNYPEKWKPAIQNGQNVRVAYTLPIRLSISK